MNRGLTHLAASLASLVTILVLAGCNSPSIASNSPYREDFEIAINEAESQFQRDVLADFAISFAEYEEAAVRWVQCVEAAGYSASFERQGELHQYSTSGAGSEGAADSCRESTLAHIEPLYAALVWNPEKKDWDELYAECLVDRGVVTEPFSGADYREAEMEYGPDDPRRPWKDDDPEARACFDNPSAR